MNENYGNGENQDFCLKFASNIPCVLCVRGTRKDIFILLKYAISFYFLPVTSIIWITDFSKNCWYSIIEPSSDFAGLIRTALTFNIMGVFLLSIYSLFLYYCCQSKCCDMDSRFWSSARTISYCIIIASTGVGIFITTELYLGNKIAIAVNSYISLQPFLETLIKNFRYKCCTG